jgi:shikimate dehydrogenase
MKMTMSGKTRVCGILAYPVEHSMSPMMQNYYAEMTGVDLCYVPLKTEPERLGDAVKGAYAMNLLGLNVTVPHKQAVMEHLVDIDEGARVIGAVNTLVRVDGGYKGYNTDAEGLLRAMKEEGIRISGRTCILVGAGGAAKAAAYILAREGAAKIYCLNRSVEKAQKLAEDINKTFDQEVMCGLPLDGWTQITETGCLAVQTTSVGMHPNVDTSPIEDPAFFEKLETAVDIIYTPARTRFMQLAATAGAKTMNGLNMLIYQGIIAYELWNPSVKVSAQTIVGAREKMLKLLGGKNA